jgi:hypothetical protein
MYIKDEFQSKVCGSIIHAAEFEEELQVSMRVFDV